MKKTETVSERAKRYGVVLCLVALVSGVLVPTPAMAGGFPTINAAEIERYVREHAEKVVLWAKENAVLGAIISTITTVNASFIAFAEELNASIEIDTGIDVAAIRAYIEELTRTTQAKIDAGVENVYAEIMSEIATEHVPSADSNLCNSVVANRSAGVTRNYWQDGTTLADSAIIGMSRGPGADGNGPSETYKALASRCNLGLGNNIDGYSSKCIKNDVKGTDGRKLADADLTASIFDGGQVLELPTMESVSEKSYKFNYPVPETDEQKFWVAGLYHCMTIAGPRPTPVSLLETLAPNGLNSRAQWNHCMAAQSALMHACTTLLNFYARPNPKDTEAIAVQKQTYDAVTALGVKLADSYAEGKKGLSPYQEGEAVHAICKADAYYVSQAKNGATEPDMMNAVDKCTLSSNSWKMFKDTLHRAMSTAVAGLSSMPGCWDKAELQ